MTTQQLHSICTQEKRKAMERYDSTNPTVKFDSAQAVNAFDELLGQLRKPKAVKPKQFDKTKQTALSIAKLIADKEYKHTITQKINTLHL